MLVSGVGLACAFPEPDLTPLAWIALVPLLVAAPAGGARRGALLGGLFGLGFFGTLLAWISLVGWIPWAALVSIQAAWLALFGLAWTLVGRSERRVVRLVAPAALWVALEYLRSSAPLGGFPWGQLAQSQPDAEWLLRLAALGGGWLVAFAVVLANAALAEAVAARRGTRSGLVALAAVVLGAPALLPGAEVAGEPVDVAIVQGGVPRLGGDLVARELAITRRHQLLTERLRPSAPDLVVWPESAVGLDLERTPKAARAVSSAARAVGAPLLVGGNLDEGPDRYRVVALLISPSGAIVDRYQKTHLVPFGEFVPARRWLGWIPLLDRIPRDAVAGSEPALFSVAGGIVAPVISFEGDFGSLVRRRIALGGRLLVVATNTSTWGRSWASAQHLAFSQVRAAENQVWVVHAALSGISAFVRPDGSVLAATALGRPATTAATVRFASSVSPYARTGDWLPLGCLVLGVGLVAAATLRAVAR